MSLRDLHTLPRIRDRWSYLYVDHARIDQDAKSIVVHDANGSTPIPVAALSTLMLGPGTTVTHAAIKSLADNGCLAIWSGEAGVRFYAQGLGVTRSAKNLLRQARLWANSKTRMEIVRRMYAYRFGEDLSPGLSLRQIRGMEGVRVRDTYKRLSKKTGVVWTGRSYRRGSWGATDPVNRALSCANACLYGICHAAIVAAGYSPALGFIHSGKLLSFVYDIADLYKTDTAFAAAFQATAEGTQDLQRRVRRECRDLFHRERLLGRIVADIEALLAVAPAEADFDEDAAAPGSLWDPDEGDVLGGRNQADDEEA